MIRLILILFLVGCDNPKQTESDRRYNENLCKELVECLGDNYIMHRYGNGNGCLFYNKNKEAYRMGYEPGEGLYQIFEDKLQFSIAFCRVVIQGQPDK